MTDAREERERRLSAALRANLKKRKARARTRTEGAGAPDAPGEDGTGDGGERGEDQGSKA